jgi:hypothetical protein
MVHRFAPSFTTACRQLQSFNCRGGTGVGGRGKHQFNGLVDLGAVRACRSAYDAAKQPPCTGSLQGCMPLLWWRCLRLPSHSCYATMGLKDGCYVWGLPGAQGQFNVFNFQCKVCCSLPNPISTHSTSRSLHMPCESMRPCDPRRLRLPWPHELILEPMRTCSRRSFQCRLARL